MKRKIIIEPELLISLYYGNEYSLDQIGEVLNCSGVTILKWMKVYEIERRNWLDSLNLRTYHLKEGYIPWNKDKTHKEDSRIPAGENHNSWRGGVTPQNKLARSSIEFKNWRKYIFERDNHTCQICHDRGRKGHFITLHPHHIKSFSGYPELRYNTNNGITLCKDCHIWVHKLKPLDFQKENS